MRYVLLSTIALLMLGALSVEAQEGSTASSEASLLASVGVSDVSLTSANRELTVSFSLSNGESVQTNVQYGILLVQGTGDAAVVVDEYVYDEKITLLNNAAVKRVVSYTAPSGLEGVYTVYVMSKNDKGFPLAFIRVDDVTLPPSLAGLTLDHARCILSIVPGNKRVPQGTIPSLKGNETLVSSCSVTNSEPGPITFTPWYETRDGSAFGPIVVAEGGLSTSVELAHGEEKVIVTPLPRAKEDGVYVVTLGYDGHGNDISYTYSVGTPARIENVLLDGSGYSSGREANVGVVVRGAGTYTLALTMDAVSGERCGETYQSIDLDGVMRVNVPLTIETTCSSPQVVVQLFDDSNELMSTYTALINLPQKPEQIDTVILSHEEGRLDFGPSFFISIIALAIGLGIFYHSLYTKGKINMPKASLVILAFLLFGVGTNAVHAATFTQGNGACSVSVSYDPVAPPILPGQAIAISGYSSCPGLQVDAQLLNAGYGFSVTANSFGGISGSYPAPPADDVISYISGDTFSDPFNLGNPMHPYDFVFTNRCVITTIDRCELPPYVTYFGEPVGTSVGACMSGSTGACNYTCQSDLTWRRNSNTCSAPLPPPSGSTPQFTSTPTCVIGEIGRAHV